MMGWSVARIEQDFLRTGIAALVLSPETVVSAFERVEKILGSEWLSFATKAKGIAPTMDVIGMGLRLAALEGIPESEGLIRHIRRNDQNADAELTAIYLFRSFDPSLTIELHPNIGKRKADFRLRRTDEQWVTVEVTRPDVSVEQKRVQKILETFMSALQRMENRFALHILFRREPTEAEVSLLHERLPEFCTLSGTHQAELKDGMGYLFLNPVEIEKMLLPQIPELEGTPRIGLTMFVAGGPNMGPHHQVSVQTPFTDERAEEILRDEARQLPTDGPGIVMINVANSGGSFAAWSSLISRRFQPQIHTRVSAVCLFWGGSVPSQGGYTYLLEPNLLTNPHARSQLPNWIREFMTSASREFNRVMTDVGTNND
jgi:hypothetical protein